MADKAHRLTDKKLEEMEKRLSAIYSTFVDGYLRNNVVIYIKNSTP